MHVPHVVISEQRTSPAKSLFDSKTGKTVHYTVEEQRRTIYLTTTKGPPDRAMLDEILRSEDKSQGTKYQTASDSGSHRRCVSLQNEVRGTRMSWQAVDSHDVVGQPSPTHSEPIPTHRKPPSTGKLLKPRQSPNTSVSGSPASSPLTPSSRRRILFYDKHAPYYGFTNFSPHPVWYENKLYPTSEHLFQSFKFHGHRPGLAEHIRTCSDRPSVAFSEARRFQPEVHRDWMQVNIAKMEEILWLKFNQHRDLKDELLATGDAELIEDSDKDSFWGIGADGKGRNELGKALERLRAQLRNM